MESKKKIFVIYTTIDSYINKELLLKINEDLKQYGNVFIDLIHNNSENKQEYVLQMLYESSHIVIVETPKIRESKWAQMELKIAGEQKKTILGYYTLKVIGEKPKIEFELKNN